MDILNILESWDMAVTLWINGFNSPVSDSIWMFFSARKIWFIMYAIVAAAMFWRLGWKKALIMIAATALCVVCADQGANLIKDWACRLRPCNDPRMIENGLHILEAPHPRYQYGFFSAHAANAMVFAICSLKAFKLEKKGGYARIYGIAITIWALLVGISRIFVGKHFAGDVLVGFAAGLVISLVICQLAQLLIKER